MSSPAVQSAATLKYADLETKSSDPKDLTAAFSHSRIPLQRLVCARSLSFENDNDIVATATKLSRDSEAPVREALATRLGQLDYGAEKSVASKIVVILQSLARDIRPEVRTAAAISLAIVPNPQRLSSWISLCRDSNPKYRCSGAECLGHAGLPAAKVDKGTIARHVLPELVALAKEDVTFCVRKTACRALGRLAQDSSKWDNAHLFKSKAAEVILFLSHDPAWPTRRAAAEMIPVLCVGGKEDVALGSALVALSESDPSQWVKLTAKRSLGPFIANSKLDAPEVLTAFCNMAKSTDEEVRFACAYSFPAVVQASASISVAEQRWNAYLKEVHATLCSDISPRIRCSLAHSLHIVAKSIGPGATARDLCGVFLSFIQDMDDEEEIRLGVIRGSAGFLSSVPLGNRREVFEMIESTRLDISTPPLASLAVSRDARLSLAQQLGDFAKIQPPTPGLGKLFLALAKDEAHHVRQMALDSFGEIAPTLDSANEVLKEFEQMSTSTHFWIRWAFARGAWSILRNDRAKKMFAESSQLERKLQALRNDPVLTVRNEASGAHAQSSSSSSS